jgi:hypothetical protein
MTTKTDFGRKAYEEEIAREPTYRASGKMRPTWDQLPETVKQAWREKHSA